MLRLLLPLALLGLMIYCFIDILTTDRRRFGQLGKGVWLIVVLLPVVGAVLWLAVGKPRRRHTSGHNDTIVQLRRRPRAVAPDDDPAFLRALDEQAWRAKREAKRHEQDESSAPAAGDRADQSQPHDSATTGADADSNAGAPDDAGQAHGGGGQDQVPGDLPAPRGEEPRRDTDPEAPPKPG